MRVGCIRSRSDMVKQDTGLLLLIADKDTKINIGAGRMPKGGQGVASMA